MPWNDAARKATFITLCSSMIPSFALICIKLSYFLNTFFSPYNRSESGLPSCFVIPPIKQAEYAV